MRMIVIVAVTVGGVVSIEEEERGGRGERGGEMFQNSVHDLHLVTDPQRDSQHQNP